MAIKSWYETKWGLRGNPFSGKATYAEDSQAIYVPEMFGAQRDEFLRKFILAPLENKQPLLGAVWSVAPGDPTARGFGKSTLMGEEAKRINRDFGVSTLVSLGVPEEDARENPVLAGYVSFNTKSQGAINSIDIAAFHLVRFLLRGIDSRGVSTHSRLRELAAARLAEQDDGGQDSDSIAAAVRAEFRGFADSIDIRGLLEDYLLRLSSPDTNELERFLAEDVNAWHHARNGLKYLQIFVVFASLAGIEYFTFFVDQVEDFTSQAGPAKIQRQVKIIRDALLETEPFATRASFVFQLHPDANERLRDAWRHEDLRPLEFDNPLNQSVVVVLKGLETFETAHVLAERCLNHTHYALPGRKGGIAPFTESALKQAWETTKPRPRWFLLALHELLQLGNSQQVATIDDAFVTPKMRAISDRARAEEPEPGASEDERLA